MTADTVASTAWDVVAEAVHRESVPGAVALVRWKGQVVLHDAAGWAAVEPQRLPMSTSSIFDLASLTKPLVTTPLVLQLVDRGAISLDDPVSRYLPPLAHFAGGYVTVRQLLTHTSGLPAWSPLYVWARTRSGVLQTIADMDPAYMPGTCVVYSCLGFITLGLLLEEVTGQPLNELAQRSLIAPLGLRNTGYGTEIDVARCAWTECGNGYERASVAVAGLNFDGWREGYLPGTVHDGNAWYAMGGVSGNAGVFGTAQDVAALAELWLNKGCSGEWRAMSEVMVAAATIDNTPKLAEGRGLGWQMNRPAESGGATEPRASGTNLGVRAFGHTGFTGTSVWIDPDLEMVAVLLTNRVHPSAGDATTITTLRSSFHDALATSIRASTLGSAP